VTDVRSKPRLRAAFAPTSSRVQLVLRAVFIQSGLGVRAPSGDIHRLCWFWEFMWFARSPISVCVRRHNRSISQIGCPLDVRRSPRVRGFRCSTRHFPFSVSREPIQARLALRFRQGARPPVSSARIVGVRQFLGIAPRSTFEKIRINRLTNTHS
jgi:hypothetical protein